MLALGVVGCNAWAGQAKLAWDAVSGATGYRLYYGTASGSYASNVDAKGVTTYTVSGLTDGARYYFAVRAYNATTTSGYSGEVNTVVRIPRPPLQPTSPPAAFGTAPVAVSFTDTSTGSITGWSWNFGNGGTSTAKNPSYTYSVAGIYTVSLTVTGSAGSNTSTKTNYITVSAPTGGTSSGGSAAVKQGLVAAFGFEESGGSQVIDASGYANHGTISGATRITTTRFGKALSFNGTNNWITVNDSGSLDLTSGITLEAWVYPTASMSGWDTVIMKERTGGLAYALYANSSANRPNNTVNVGGIDRELTVGSYLPANTWTHLAVTYNGSTQQLYVNGALAGSRAQTGAITLSGGALRIGGNSVWGEYFKGYIDEVRIYNRVLSQGEISADSRTAVVGLVVSTSSNRSNSVPLNGLTVSGNIYISYVHISPTATSKPVKTVKFWLDNANPPNPTGSPRITEYSSPFDFASGSASNANPFSTTGLSKGVHTVTAQVTLSDGTVLPYVVGTFRIQ